jgi:Bifunctional DNA primase/polymerase, N-terminal
MMGARQIKPPRWTEPRNLQAALAYAQRGWHVLPVDDSKRPLTSHGVNDATIDSVQVHQWWDQHPTANVAVRTGADSGIVCLDVDRDKGGFDSLRALLADREFPDTLVAKTGGGGRAEGPLLPARTQLNLRALCVGRGPGGGPARPPLMVCLPIVW